MNNPHYVYPEKIQELVDHLNNIKKSAFDMDEYGYEHKRILQSYLNGVKEIDDQFKGGE